MMGDAAEHDRQRQERLHQVRGCLLVLVVDALVNRVAGHADCKDNAVNCSVHMSRLGPRRPLTTAVCNASHVYRACIAGSHT
jgi:hypothetical protein